MTMVLAFVSVLQVSSRTKLVPAPLVLLVVPTLSELPLVDANVHKASLTTTVSVLNALLGLFGAQLLQNVFMSVARTQPSTLLLMPVNVLQVMV